MGSLKKIFLVLSLVLATLSARAQFYVDGTDPGKIRWKQVETENYRVIYPNGMDSLGRVYARELERWRVPVGQSAGYLPGQFVKGKMPVVLHGYHALSNGSVAWAPKRLDLYLSPETYDPVPIPWVDMLAIHEQRHAAQMQTGLARTCRPFNWIVGEMFNGAISAAYGGSTWLEGDAVVTETALTRSGRGRMDNFLNWYWVSFDNGDWRNWYRWKNSSQRYYVPNRYALGYVLISGMRYNHNAVSITGNKMTSFSERPWEWGIGYIARTTTGKETKDAFMESAHSLYKVWKENADSRGPYMSTQRIVEETQPIELWGEKLDIPESYTEYKDLVRVGDCTYAVRKGLLFAPSLVRIEKDGTVNTLRPFAYYAGGLELSADGKKLLWSETVNDRRWELASTSVIMSYDLKTGIVKRLSRNGQLYHPHAYQDGILVTDYDYAGARSVSLLSGKKKQVLGVAPEGLQIVETTSIREEIYASGLSWDGFGIYRLHDGKFETVLEPQPVSMRDLYAQEGYLWFTSDRSGVEEFYRFDPASKELSQMTSTRYGGRDYRFSEDGSDLIFSASTIHGHTLSKTPVASLPVKAVNFADYYHNPVADTLSIQEQRFHSDTLRNIVIGEEKNYRKVPHLFQIHSWAPIYFDYDRIKDFSLDNIYESASPGLTGLFQNSLGTSILQVGYSAHPDNDGIGPWRHSGHLKWTWSGWYPVIDMSLDFNDRLAHRTGFRADTEDGIRATLKAQSTRIANTPLVDFSISAYIPFNFSSSGWYRGFVPRIRYSISNDSYDTAPDWYLKLPYKDADGKDRVRYEFVRKTTGWQFPSQSISASVRAYSIMSTPTAAVYPRLGIGAEAGFHTQLAPGGLNTTTGERPMLSPHFYAYLYGYLPGIIRQQGLRLSAKMAFNTRSDAMFHSYMLNTLPRGLQGTPNLAISTCGSYKESLLLTADYAIPIWSGDWDWRYFAFVKRFVLTPHFDYMLSHKNGADSMESLFSAGCDFGIDFETVAWIATPISIGLRIDYSGGHDYDRLSAGNSKMKHWYFGPIFSVSF